VSSVDKTTAVVVSTLMEAWEVVRAGLVADGTVNDVRVIWFQPRDSANQGHIDTLWFASCYQQDRGFVLVAG
jgi:hypothetical protein